MQYGQLACAKEGDLLRIHRGGVLESEYASMKHQHSIAYKNGSFFHSGPEHAERSVRYRSTIVQPPQLSFVRIPNNDPFVLCMSFRIRPIVGCARSSASPEIAAHAQSYRASCAECRFVICKIFHAGGLFAATVGCLGPLPSRSLL